MAPFDYLVVVDFQVTSGSVPEIIEFPWVVFDVAALQTVDEKQIYIKPEQTKRLSAECQRDTGINDSMLEGACSLQVCVQSFNDYVYRSFVATNKEFCVITCNELALKYHLWVDAQNKGIKLSAQFLRFLDLSAEFRKFYPQWGAIYEMHDIAERMGISLDRSVKGGLQMCRAAANILARMTAEGAVFPSIVEISDNHDPSSDQAVQATLARRNSAPSAPQHVAEPVAAQSSRAPSNSLYVKVRGISFSGNEQDVVHLFEGIRIPPGGITMCWNHTGQFNGEAVVRFSTPQDVRKALECNGNQVLRRAVEVVSSSAEELRLIEQAYDAVRTMDYTDVMFPGVIRMRGLPFNVDILMVLDFLGEPLSGKVCCVVLCEARDGRRNGEAYVEFTSEGVAVEAQKKHREMIGTRYIEIFKVRKGDMIKYLESRFADGGGFPPPRPPARPLGVPPLSPHGTSDLILRMRGLPFVVRDSEVIEFFGRAGVTPSALRYAAGHGVD